MQGRAAATWQAGLAADRAAGVPLSSAPICVNVVVKLPGRCPQLVDAAFMALLQQKIAGLPTVRAGGGTWAVLLISAE